MKEEICGFAIALDPSMTGNKETNDEWRKQSCPTCGYPKANAGELCEECKVKAVAEEVQARISFDIMMGFPTGLVHSFTHQRYLDPSDRYDKQFLDP